MLEQQDSLNSSHSEATGRMWAPANLPALHQGTQPVALPCQQRHRQHTTVVSNVHQQPRLIKAVLDQHEKAALTSLLLMQQQSSPMKVCQHHLLHLHAPSYVHHLGLSRDAKVRSRPFAALCIVDQLYLTCLHFYDFHPAVPVSMTSSRVFSCAERGYPRARHQDLCSAWHGMSRPGGFPAGRP